MGMKFGQARRIEEVEDKWGSYVVRWECVPPSDFIKYVVVDDEWCNGLTVRVIREWRMVECIPGEVYQRPFPPPKKQLQPVCQIPGCGCTGDAHP